MLPAAERYKGYRSYSYLEAGKDYQEFKLAPEMGRVPLYEGLTLSDAQKERVAQLLTDNIVISLHEHPTILPADLRELIDYERSGREHTGYEGLAHSGMTAFFDGFMDGTAYVTSLCGWKWNDVLHDLGMRLCDLAQQDFIVHARSVAEIREAHRSGRMALVAHLEGATMIENELDRIEVLYGFGVRCMGITYSEANGLGSGRKESRDAGLTAFGRAAVRRMNQIGMAIDIAHCGENTAYETVVTSAAPVLLTHGGSRGVWDSPTHMNSDKAMKACAERGGLVGVTAAPHLTYSPRYAQHNLDAVMDHFVYLVDLLGLEHVGFGPDTQFGDHLGVHYACAKSLNIEDSLFNDPHYSEKPYVDGAENPAECFWNIIGWLVEHGYSDDEIKAVIGGNALRVLEQIWGS
jgi:membrane dipeptidase